MLSTDGIVVILIGAYKALDTFTSNISLYWSQYALVLGTTFDLKLDFFFLFSILSMKSLEIIVHAKFPKDKMLEWGKVPIHNNCQPRNWEGFL